MVRDRTKSWRMRVDTAANREDGLHSEENAKIIILIIFHFFSVSHPHHLIPHFLPFYPTFHLCPNVFSHLYIYDISFILFFFFLSPRVFVAY